jgi:mannose/fructose/N-acetylgalactosamine-specific phosphotransferase system component IID
VRLIGVLIPVIALMQSPSALHADMVDPITGFVMSNTFNVLFGVGVAVAVYSAGATYRRRKEEPQMLQWLTAVSSVVVVLAGLFAGLIHYTEYQRRHRYTDSGPVRSRP